MHIAYRVIIAAGLAGIAAAAPGHLLGGRAGVGVDTPAIDSAVRGTTDTVRGMGDDVRDTTRSTATVKVEGGASTRVDRGTRSCDQPDDYSYDPVYRDGYYYCERRSRGAAAGAQAGASTRR